MRLARTSDRHDPAFIDAIAATRRAVESLEEHAGRRVFLLAQLAALERRARFLAGRRVTIREEAMSLGLSVPVYDPQKADVLHRELDAALPGRGPVAARLADRRRRRAVPRSALGHVAEQAVADCRTRGPDLTGLADGGLELRYVLGVTWPAFTTYGGGGRSIVEIRRDVAWLEDDLLAVLCHETYPGHHVQHLVWDDLRRTRGWREFGVIPMFTPHGVMAERTAVAATALVVPPGSRSAVARILDAFAPLALATAVAIADNEMDRGKGLARLRDDLLMPDPDGFLAFVERYRSMAVAYATPAPDVHDQQSYLALLRSPARLVAGAAQ